jgi:hypothetical protein
VANRAVAATISVRDRLGRKWIMGHPPGMAEVLSGCLMQSQGTT